MQKQTCSKPSILIGVVASAILFAATILASPARAQASSSASPQTPAASAAQDSSASAPAKPAAKTADAKTAAKKPATTTGSQASDAAKTSSASAPATATKKPAPAATAKTGTAAATKTAKAGAGKATTAKSEATLTLTTPKEKTSYAIGINVGRGLGQNIKQSGVDIDPAILARAIQDALSGAKQSMTDQEAQATLSALQNDMRAKQQEVADSNKKEGEDFLAANKSKEGVVALPDGLQYKVLQEGTGPKPAASDTVTVNYRGTLVNGTEFDSSFKTGQPASFPVGGVIKGWTEALQLMPVGSKWQLFIPSDLAYGPRGNRGIAPNSTLVFEVELLSIQPKAPAPAPAAAPPSAPPAGTAPANAPAPKTDPAPTPTPTPKPPTPPAPKPDQAPTPKPPTP